MRESLSAQWVQLASIAVLVLFLAPLPVLTPPEPERYVLAEIAGFGLGPALAAHAEVVEVYEGNLALLKVTGSEVAQLRWSGVPITELADRTTIRFADAGITFDTAAGEPSLSPMLRASDPHAFVVQFIGPIKAEWMARIRGMGASPQMYVANAAFVVRMDAGTARAVGRIIPRTRFPLPCRTLRAGPGSPSSGSMTSPSSRSRRRSSTSERTCSTSRGARPSSRGSSTPPAFPRLQASRRSR
jgi:hypothetical protein